MICIAFLCWSSYLHGQERLYPKEQNLLTELRNRASKGDKIALRDLGGLLDDPARRDDVIPMLKRLIFFPESLLPEDSLHKTPFLRFFYEHLQEIRFSEIIGGFYTTPIEQCECAFSIDTTYDRNAWDKERLDHLTLLSDSLRSGAVPTIENMDRLVDWVTVLDNDRGYEILFQLCNNAIWERAASVEREEIRRKLIRSIAGSSRMEGMSVLLEGLKKGVLSETETVFPLVLLTNTQVAPGIPIDSTRQFFQHMLDSIGSFEALRFSGMEPVFDFKPVYFEHKADYFGKVLSRKPNGMILQNAIADMLLSKDPVSLFYLAAYLFEEGDKDPMIRTPHLDMLEQWSGDRIRYKYRDAESTRPDTCWDIAWRKSFLCYWASHYHQYHWDDYQNRYVNQVRVARQQQACEQLFSLLAQDDRELALQAFGQLAKSDPKILNDYKGQHRSWPVNLHPDIPDLKYKYLENLSQLHAYLLSKGFRLAYPVAAKKIVDSLQKVVHLPERYRLENRLISLLDLDGVNALEFDACIRSYDVDFSSSASRILDYWYSLHYEAIFHDPQHLALYLKKASLFSGIGETGICNLYLNKISSTDSLASRLAARLLSQTADPDIYRQCLLLLSRFPDRDIAWRDFFDAPGWTADMRFRSQLPGPDPTELEILVNMILQSPDEREVQALFDYWEEHLDLTSVPYLFYILEARPSGLVEDKMYEFLASIYQYPVSEAMAPLFWLEKWRSDAEHYLTWGMEFYRRDLERLILSDTLRIADFNKVTGSKYLTRDDLHHCLAQLPRLWPKEDISMLTIAVDLDTSFLNYFTGLALRPKDWMMLLRLFDDVTSDAVLPVIWDRIRHFSPEDQGMIVNNLFNLFWFRKQVRSERLPADITEGLKQGLLTYLNESQFISEYEEQNTLMHIIQLENFGKSLEDKLLSSFQPELQVEIKARMQQYILAGADTADLAVLLLYAGEMDYDFWEWVRRDLGIPIYPRSPEDIAFFTRLLTIEFLPAIRWHYTRQIQPDLIYASGELDRDRIWQILNYDLAIPFAGHGGVSRDIIQFAVIKILEQQYGTTLGFHPKLSENQTFYTYSPRKRAIAWKKFLSEKDVQWKNRPDRPSFTDIQMN